MGGGMGGARLLMSLMGSVCTALFLIMELDTLSVSAYLHTNEVASSTHPVELLASISAVKMG